MSTLSAYAAVPAICMTICIYTGVAHAQKTDPFGKIILTCAIKEFPPALIAQLREGGRIIAPLGKPSSVQQLVLTTKENGKLKQKKVLPVRFVPMTGKALENR